MPSSSPVPDESMIVRARAWHLRLQAVPTLPGPVEQWLQDLETTLRSVSSAPVPADSTMWRGEPPIEGKGDILLHRLGPTGLVKKSREGTLELTNEALTWLRTRDNAYLTSLLHSRIRFIGEALAAIANGARTSDQLLKVASDTYGLGWNSLDQVRRRVGWLRATGYVEKWNHFEVTATAAGLDLLSRLDLTDPSSISFPASEADATVMLPDATPLVAKLLEGLDEQALLGRKRNIGFVPAGMEGETLFESLRRLVTFCSPSIERSKFADVCGKELGLSNRSAETALGMLRATGLVHQVACETFGATPYAQEWLESAEPVDLIRILHAHVLMFGELITFAPTPTDVGTLMASAHALLGDDTPQRSEIGLRLRLLASAGLVARVSYGSYVATPLGRAFLGGVPRIDISGAEPKDGHTTADGRQVAERSIETPVERLITDMMAAATDSRNPERFERVLYQAMLHLGFRTRHFGTSGTTDLLLSAWLSPGESRRIIVDAKTAASGEVLEGAISFDAIEEHRSRHNADRVAVIGPSFPDGRLQTWARRRGVRLIDVPTLAHYLRLNERAPLVASVLAGIFDVEAANPDSLWDSTVRRQDVMRHVVATLWREANDEREVARSGGALDVTAIRYLLRDKLDPDPEEIQEVLSFLTHPIVKSVKKAGDKYFPLEPPSVTAAKLRALSVAAASDQQAAAVDGELVVPAKAIATRSSASANLTSLPPHQVDAAAVRKWALERGRAVRPTGRIPAGLISDYLAAKEDLETISES